MKRQIIKTNGEVIGYTPKLGAHYELEELQDIVGGFIEIICLGKNKIMVVAEEGKLKGMCINEKATDIAHEASAIFDDDYIVGDVLICRRDDIL